jgi:hypothetical protein
VTTITCGDIGEGQRQIEYEPLELPETPPIEAPAPAPAEPEPQPA